MAENPLMNNLKGSCNIGFHYQDGFLFCEDIAVKDVEKALKATGTFPNTPFFLYSKNQIIKNIESYKKPFAELGIRYNLNYAMKANMNPCVLRLVKECQCSVTLVSGLELRLALEIGFKPEHLLLNGNGKQDWEVELAVRSGCLLNIDSEFNLQQTSYVCKQLKKTASVLLRVTPDIDPKVHPYVSTGQKSTKFGLPIKDLDPILELIRSEPLIELVGLHCHLGSCIDDIDIFRKSAKRNGKQNLECAEILVGLFTKVKTKGFEKMKYLNVGGGLALDYKRYVDVSI
ncbi:hypothetical protein CHS0354_029985 [Potamilus streckersoni]|uniref:Orn/DAP/Arg decarboxylase 2 N-terminal domain-containing protein n=1 Tax=Potamilus streckersoni TaxID=2493646 RepID=A0AAE0TKQ3_9BIVA|nr:hypothetical protein CHS0354_029985 [Potamilus streckersoni]